jgi:hypothetical protein
MHKNIIKHITKPAHCHKRKHEFRGKIKYRDNLFNCRLKRLPEFKENADEYRLTFK